ncbi:MAG: hypothetical protein EHM81_04235 [Chloroflexi bacterium]|nr:MAG: hypothetical protein EHM81_04235 [Chloroflexota bacterium]
MSLGKLFKNRIWQIAWQLFSRLFILIGLAWLAWGLDDFGGFLSNPVRLAYVTLIVAQTLFIGWLLLRIPPNPDHEQHRDLEHWHYSLVELIYILSAFGDRRNILAWVENPALRWAGLGIYLLGMIYAAWANITWVNHLRREGGSALDNAVLLTEGPYRWVRYPSLLMLAFYGLGFALAFRSWTGLAIFVPLLVTIARRASLWDKDYAARYKKAWDLRARESKRIIPFLY